MAVLISLLCYKGYSLSSEQVRSLVSAFSDWLSIVNDDMMHPAIGALFTLLGCSVVHALTSIN